MPFLSTLCICIHAVMCADADEQQWHYISRPCWWSFVLKLLMWNSGLHNVPILCPQLEKEEGLKEGKRFVNAVRDPGFCCHFKWLHILNAVLALVTEQRARKGTRGSDIHLCCKIIFSLLWWNKTSSLCLDRCLLEKAMRLLKSCVFNFVLSNSTL